MDELTIWVDQKHGELPVRDAILAITDDWVDYGNCCNATVVDLRDACAALLAEVERLREWEAFAAHEIATLKSSAGYLRDEVERRWQVAFERVGRALDAHEMAMERAKHDYDASCAGAVLADAVRAVCDEFLPTTPKEEE